jgi:thiol-disulfide isomerase/thioredoxin
LEKADIGVYASLPGRYAARGILMAEVLSQMLPRGTEAPGFSLPDPDGQLHSLDDAPGSPAYLVMFICNHCPYVKHIRGELSKLGSEYAKRDVAIYAINSNDAQNYPGDSPDNMKLESARWNYQFPYLIDADQSVAQVYKAACTPDIFLFDDARKLVYRGQLDSSRPSNDIPVNGKDLRTALDAVLAGKPVPQEQTPSIGCSIKWKSGNAP